jgi:hypothetical protein
VSPRLLTVCPTKVEYIWVRHRSVKYWDTYILICNGVETSLVMDQDLVLMGRPSLIIQLTIFLWKESFADPLLWQGSSVAHCRDIREPDDYTWSEFFLVAGLQSCILVGDCLPMTLVINLAYWCQEAFLFYSFINLFFDSSESDKEWVKIGCIPDMGNKLPAVMSSSGSRACQVLFCGFPCKVIRINIIIKSTIVVYLLYYIPYPMQLLVTQIRLQAVLQIRLYALYFHFKPVAIFLGILFLGEIAVCSETLITTALQTHSMYDSIWRSSFSSPTNYSHLFSLFNSVTSHQIKGIVTACISLPPSPAPYFQFWLPIITYEALLGTFAIWIGMCHMREMKRWDFNGLVNIVIRDSLLYFIASVLHFFFRVLAPSNLYVTGRYSRILRTWLFGYLPWCVRRFIVMFWYRHICCLGLDGNPFRLYKLASGHFWV